MYNAFLARFCMWVQHIVCPMVVEEEKKDQIHDQNGNEPDRCMSFKDIRGRQNVSFFQKGEIPASASIDAYGFLLKHY
jgi:hypothetical protein